MRDLNVIRGLVVRWDEAGAADHQGATELSGQASKNRLHVIEGALSVEDVLEQIVAQHFIGYSNTDLLADFQQWILSSEWCSFAAKMKLVLEIIRKAGFMEKKSLEALEKLIRKVMSYRNAFTHGVLASDGKKVWLRYSENGRKEVELTDEFLLTVEGTLISAHGQLDQVGIELGKTQWEDSKRIRGAKEE